MPKMWGENNLILSIFCNENRNKNFWAGRDTLFMDNLPPVCTFLKHTSVNQFETKFASDQILLPIFRIKSRIFPKIAYNE